MHEFEGRTHLVLSMDGWETVADFVSAWMEKSHFDQPKHAIPA